MQHLYGVDLTGYLMLAGEKECASLGRVTTYRIVNGALVVEWTEPNGKPRAFYFHAAFWDHEVLGTKVLMRRRVGLRDIGLPRDLPDPEVDLYTFVRGAEAVVSCS